MAGRNTSTLKTLEKAMSVHEAIEQLESTEVPALAEHLDLPVSTTYDYVRSLREAGFVVRDGTEYRLSLRHLHIGNRIKYRMQLFRAIEPELETLASQTGQMAVLQVEENGYAVILHLEQGPESLELGVYPGIHVPLHTSAPGKSILAHLPRDRLDRILESSELAPSTDHSITDRDELLDVLADLREKGYCVDWDEQIQGMGTIGVPLRSAMDDPIAVGLAGPSSWIRNHEEHGLVEKVRQAAHNASMRDESSRRHI